MIYLALAIYLLPVFPNGGAANETVNLATTVSLVEYTSFDISRMDDLLGEDRDAVPVGEGVYSKRPPGFSLLAAPLYALSRVFTGRPNRENLGISWFVLRFCLSTLPLLFLAVWLFQKDADAYSLAALLFATPLFGYSLLLFSHVLVAVLVYFTFRLLFDVKNAGLRSCLQGGLFAGFAAFCEFPALIPAVIFALGLLFTESRHRSRRLFFYLVGFVPFPALLLIYNYLIFGTPLPVFYPAEYGFALPTPYNLYLTLFSPSRGLFFFSPILLFSIFAFFTARETGTLRKRVKITAILFSLVLMSGYAAVRTDWMLGAAPLLFVVPLMLDSFFDGEIEEYPSLWRGFMFAVSFLLCLLPVLTFPFAPPAYFFPHNTFWQPLLFGEQWFAPTLAESFVQTPGGWVIWPAAGLAAVAVYLVWRRAKYPLTCAIGILSAVLAVGIYLFVPTFDGPAAQTGREKVLRQYRN